MPITGRQLADGQLPNAEAALYTAPGGTITYVKSIVLTNVHAANTDTIELFLRPSAGVSRRLIKIPLAPSEQLYFDTPIALDTGDAIRGLATNALEVDYVINGGEET